MTADVHIIPVGFDFERLSQPISQGNLDADRIRLLRGSSDSEAPAVRELAGRMLEQLEFTFDRILGIEVETDEISDIYGFEDAYVMAYEMISDEVSAGNSVWINISSMPRTIAFAFATAANSLIVEDPDLREAIHTYYVSPEEYLVTDMVEELRETRDFLEAEVDETSSEAWRNRLNSLDQLVSQIDESGVTKGARQMNGGLHVEFPAVASGELREFEEDIIQYLHQSGPTESTSALARQLAEALGSQTDDSFRSKVQYNVKRLEEKGYVDRAGDESYQTQLSTMGRLWAETHLE